MGELYLRQKKKRHAFEIRTQKLTEKDGKKTLTER